MIDQELLARLTGPNYGPARKGFSKHIGPPPEGKIVFYFSGYKNGEPARASRPTIPWDAFDRFDNQGRRLCRIKSCKEFSLGGQWRHCSYKHSGLFQQEVRYYDWELTRQDVQDRDKDKCVLCGKERDYGSAYNEPFRRPLELQCDHIIPWHFVLTKYPDMGILEKIHRFYLNRENLRTLCTKCHQRVTASFLHNMARHRRVSFIKGDIKPLENYLNG